MERPTRSTRANLAASASEFAAAVESAVAANAAASQPTAFLSVSVDPLSLPGGAAAMGIREQVVELLRRNLRQGDELSHETEEIALLLPATTRDQAVFVASRLAAAVRQHGFPGTTGDRPRVGVTISLGIATAPSHGTSIDHLADAARRACRHVRDAGGDSFAVAPMRQGGAPERQLEINRFAGRTEEVARLRRALDDAIAGSPRAVAVLGEAGSGRGTLLRQLESEVRLRGGSLVVARASRAGVRTPYAIWSQLLEALQRLPDAPTRAWNELIHLDSRLPAANEERAGSKFRLLDEISEYVRLCARSRPLVVVLEEMQWADGASWDALDYLLTGLERERLLVCFTMREDPGQTEILDRRKALERFANYDEIRLSRLTRDEVKRWLESAMQRQEVGREALAFVYRHTEGNPLFIGQLARCMLEEGSIRHTGTRWEWSPVSELRLPNGLDEIIERRLQRLAAETQDVLCAAAVIGRQFDMEVLHSAAGVPADHVHAAVREAVSLGIMSPSYERGGRGQAFVHERVAEALVSSMPPERLARAHLRVARALEARPDAVVETALHFDAAGSAAEAYAYALKAAEQAERLYAHSAAGEFLQVASRNALSPAELAEARVRMAHMAETLGRFDETEELCDLAIEWFSSRGDRLRALTLRRMRERARRELGQPAKVTLEALRALDEEAKALGSDQERIEILTMESQNYARIGDLQRAEKLAEECVEMAERVGDPALLAGALNRLGITIRTQTPQRAREYFERALALFQKIGDVRGQARCHNNLGITQLEPGADLGRESLTMAMTLARAAGMLDLSGTAALNLGVLMGRIGDHDRARQLYDDAMRLFAAVKNSELQLYALYNMANVERDTGNYEQSAELYDATSSLAQRIGSTEVEIGAMAGEGLCLLAMGRMDAVRRHAAEIERRVADIAGWFAGREIVDAFRVRTAVADGRAAEAMDTYERAARDAEAWDLYTVAWLTAAVADVLIPHYPEQMQAALQKYSGQIAAQGFTDLVRKYQSLQGLPQEPVQA